MKKSIWGLIALSGALSAATAHAQSSVPEPTVSPEVPPLITDRPDFTESPQTVPRGMTQIEGGVTFERSGREKNTTYGEALVRIAVGDSAELRVGIPSYLSFRGDGAHADGFDDSFLGAKFAIVKRERFPFSVLVGTTLPTGQRRVASRKYNPEIKLASEVELSKKVGLAFNVGAGRPDEGAGRYNQLFASASFGFDLSDRVGAYAEVYAFNRDERGGNSKQFINGGFTYAVNPNLQLDARAGLGIANDVNGPDYFTGVGATQRF